MALVVLDEVVAETVLGVGQWRGFGEVDRRLHLFNDGLVDGLDGVVVEAVVLAEALLGPMQWIFRPLHVDLVPGSVLGRVTHAVTAEAIRQQLDQCRLMVGPRPLHGLGEATTGLEDIGNFPAVRGHPVRG